MNARRALAALLLACAAGAATAAPASAEEQYDVHVWSEVTAPTPVPVQPGGLHASGPCRGSSGVDVCEPVPEADEDVDLGAAVVHVTSGRVER